MALGPYTSNTFPPGFRMSWLRSRHGVDNAVPGTLKASAFSAAAGVTNGIVPSGYPVMFDAQGFLVPFTGTDGSKLRFSLGDRDTSRGDETTAVIWHGEVITAKLPITFTPPAAGGQFTFI